MTGAIQRTNKLQTGVLVAVAVGLIAVGLPALVFLSVFGRVLLVAVVVAACVTVVASPRLRRSLLFAEEAPDGEYKGLRVAEGVLLHPSHSWARLMPGMKAKIGVDDLAQKVLGPSTAVELPEKGAVVRQGDPLFTLRRAGRTLRVRAPLSGRVVALNEALRDDPSPVHDSPYREGWVVEIAAEDLNAEEPRLSGGQSAYRWFKGEIDRFVGIMISPSVPSQVLADGGAIADDLHQSIDDETWAKVEAEFFGQDV